ncbi:DUF6255 family natural product biosynthesis protein [Streptomyces cinnamoneus]|uniref:DUF6255 family natural product biosynthesis protein n=1 Tax=Streptomyces cinnamoneus TaxID=53446 RepID=UPI00379415B9
MAAVRAATDSTVQGLTSTRPAAKPCPHPAWATTGGIATCVRCATRRVTDYRALAQALEPPERTALFAVTATCTGPMGGPADPARRRELLRRLREVNLRSRRGRP